MGTLRVNDDINGCKKMSNRLLPNWLSAYERYTEFSEAPDQFHFWTGVSVIAGALRRHVWIEMGYFQWTPCFYIIFVAPPGIVSKSTTANIGMNLLRSVPGIHFGPDVVTWQSLVQSLARSTEGFEYDALLHTMSTITIVSSELGTFLNPSDREMVDVLVSLWDGQIGTWEKATKTQGNDTIANPWINLIACTTPAWIAGNFPEYMIGGGFTSRTIFVFADAKRKLVAYPSEHVNASHEALKKHLIHDLEAIATGIVGPYTLTQSARDWGTEWYERLYEEKKTVLASDRFAGYVARKQTHMHKLAMILAASESNHRQIDTHHLVIADRRLVEAEKHMERVFEQITNQDTKAQMTVLSELMRNGKEDITIFRQKMFNRLSKSQVEEGIDSCVAAGFIQKVAVGNRLYLVPTPVGVKLSEGQPQDE